MTKKVLTYSFAAAALLSGCADDFQNYESAQIEGGKGRLVEAGLLGGSVEMESTSETRAYTPRGRFVWMPEEVAATGEVTENTNQKIGLCWTGVNTKTPEFGAIQAPGENVYTNYLFEHVGWMEDGASSISIDQCTGLLLNGAYWIDAAGIPAVPGGIPADINPNYQTQGDLGNSTAGLKERYTPYYFIEERWPYYRALGQYEYTDIVTGVTTTKKLNLGAGVFKTENSSVFEGQYIVYFPYTDKFTKGAIVAHEPRQFQINCDHDKYETFSKYAFCAGYQSHYAGGTAQDAFSTGIYTGSVTIALKHNDKWDVNNYAKKIKRVILYSQEKGIIYETGISAASIVEARQAGDMSLVKQVGEAKTSNVIYADLTDNGGSDYYTVNIPCKNYDPVDLITIPVLPQITDLSVILVDEEEKTLKYEAETKEYEIKAGKNLKLVVDVKDGFKQNYYAVDEPSFVDALKKVNTQGFSNWWEMNYITLLCDIHMSTVNDGEYTTPLDAITIEAQRNLTIQADASAISARLIVDGQTERNIQVSNNKNFYINVPVVVEGYGCCYTTPGTLNIYPNQLEDGNNPASSRLRFNSNVINYGKTNINFDAAGEVINFNGKVINSWDDEYARETYGYANGTWGRQKNGGVLTVDNTVAKVVKLYLNGGIENDATVNFGVATTAALAATDADALGNRSLRVTAKNIVNAGKKRSGAGVATSATDVPGGLLEINNNVLVTVTEGISNNNEFGIIHVVGEGNSNTTDGRLDVQKSEASSNSGTIDNDGVINLMGSGNLDNSNGLFLDNLTGQVGGKPVNNGAARTAGDYSIKYKQGIHAQANTYQTDLNDGIYATKTASNYRLSFILNDLVESKSCNVIDIVGAVDAVDGGNGYDLTRSEYNGKDLAGYDVRINASSAVRFIYGEKDPEDTYKFVGSKSLGHCMDVYTNAVLDRSNEFTIENNLFVRGGGYLTENDKLAFFHVANKIEVEVGGNLTVNATAGAPAKFATSSRGIQARDIMNSGTITTKETFTVDNDFNIYYNYPVYGTLTAEGTDNTVGNNFNLWGKATFAPKTTTIINGTFNSYGEGSLITRLGIGGGNDYRATVNCDTLGATQGNAVGGWPTEF